MPMNDIALHRSSLGWHSPIFLSLLANGGNFAQCQFIEILRNLLLERSIIVVSSDNYIRGKSDLT